MILILHIAIALASIFYTAYVFFSPSKSKLIAVYSLVALTFISGFYLILIKPAHLAQVCQTGLIYLAAELVGIFATKNKLEKLTTK